MKISLRAINIDSCAKTVQVDNRMQLRYYYRIADSLIKQASIYREENNLIDLYIILLRFSSLMCETIPLHRDYNLLHPNEKQFFKKKLFGVLDELEALKPVVQREIEKSNRGHAGNLGESTFNNYASLPPSAEQPLVKTSSHLLMKHNNGANLTNMPDQLRSGRQFQKMSFSLPNPKQETLSRHSILGPNGLRGQWGGSIVDTKVQYPSHIDMAQTEALSLQPTQNSQTLLKDGNQGMNSDMESVLSLFDVGFSLPPEEDFVPLIRQPSPPPVLAQVHELPILDPSKIADPRPGFAKTSDSPGYQHVHISAQMMEAFLKIAESNTKKNLETCGVLAGSLKNSKFYVRTLIIPKQESTSDSCQTTNEEEIFDVQDKRSLFPLGWIHTHPTQTCFMSSVDLHTHYSYQVMLPEAIAIVMAPTDQSRTHGIFHLTEPGGVSVIRNCQQRGFHPHGEPEDGSAIYEHCSHVYMNLHLEFEVLDLR
ncbi:AMSH-like ubiquitin thioesterase 3 [Wolffia australiana]